MLAVLAVICGIITAVLIVLMVQMHDVHASSADLDCRLSFKQFKSFYKLKPDCWRIHMNSLRYVPAVQGLVRAVRFRRWIDVIRYGFFVCAEAHKEDQKVRDANTLSLIQDIQRDIDDVKQQADAQIERGRQRFVELWNQFRETHDTIDENEVLEILKQVQEDLGKTLC